MATTKVSKITEADLTKLVAESLFVEDLPTSEISGSAYYVGPPTFAGKAKVIYVSYRAGENICYEGIASSLEVAKSIACYAVGIDGGYHMAVVTPAEDNASVDYEVWSDFIVM